MKTRNRFLSIACQLAAVCAALLPGSLSAATVVEIEQAQVVAWAASQEVVTVPAGTTYKLFLPDGDTVILTENTLFKVKENEDGMIERVIILSGSAVLDRASKDGSGDTFIFEADGKEFVSDGSDVAISVGEDGSISIAQLGDSGDLSIGEFVIPAGSGGTVGGDGSFDESIPVRNKLTNDAMQTIRRAQPEPGPRPPFERMKPLPREIVEENLNDISPS